MYTAIVKTRLIGLFVIAIIAGCGSSEKHTTSPQTIELELELDLARTYIAKDARAAAIPLLRRYLARHPNSAEAHVLYGSVLRDLGLYPQSKQQLERALVLVPKYAAAHAELGILCDLQSQTECALYHHRRAIKLAPHSAKFENNLGFSLYLSGKANEAIPHLERALALDPTLDVAYNNLGFAYGRRGDDADAKRTFRTIGGKRGELMNMVLVYEDRGELDRAEKARAKLRAMDAAPVTPEVRNEAL